MATRVLDLRGLSCPQPVFETKRAIERSDFKEATILVDSRTSVENITRLLSSRGDIRYTVEEGEDYTIKLSKV
jgi:tRNA 2-thiouridine synthesizing protein A